MGSQAASTVFADVSDAFSSIMALRQRLDSWREQQPAAYEEAYMEMSAPALFAPFVRLQLLSWEPLHPTSGHLHSLHLSPLVPQPDSRQCHNELPVILVLDNRNSI